MNDELIKMLAESKLEEAYKECQIKYSGSKSVKRCLDDPLEYYSHEFHGEGILSFIELKYCFNSYDGKYHAVLLTYYLDNLKKEIRTLKINKIL